MVFEKNCTKITMSTVDMEKKPLEDFFSLPHYIGTVLGAFKLYALQHANWVAKESENSS